ncbi:MAG: response regulator [Cellulosilyticum sp.]|nr:response regulator [Cellulosilyticum sp.]
MRIVLVDKDNQCLTKLEGILERSNPQDDILLFTDSYRALDYISSYTVDEVYIEIDMYDTTGLALTRQIKEMSKYIKVILMASSEEYAIEAWRVHADYFLVKPVTLEAIWQMRE